MEMIDVLSKHTNVNQLCKAAETSGSLEELLETCFSESGHDICIMTPSIADVVPHLCRFIVGREITDHSHYDGYIDDPRKPAIKSASLILDGSRLFLNEYDLQCSLDDPALQSLRIQLHRRQHRQGDKVQIAVPEASLYFDFWDGERGFAKKCVILSIRLGRKKVAKMEAEIGAHNQVEAGRRIQDLQAKQIPPNDASPPDPKQLALL